MCGHQICQSALPGFPGSSGSIDSNDVVMTLTW